MILSPSTARPPLRFASSSGGIDLTNGPNAVKSVALAAGGTRTYCYDATGNMTSDNAGLAMRYDHTQRPVRIARGAVIQNFDYGPDGSRYRQWGTDGELMYFGAVERQYAPTVQDKTYVGSSVVVTQAGTTRRVDYLLTDRLGSVDALADSSGAMLETRGFDAFGKPRSGTWADATKLASTANSRHGFTGHEHLNSLSLIHMNGRVYDYNLGRFTGVDPVIQFPLNSQSLNPYSYILNNPLSGTDPTGYTSCGEVSATAEGSGSCEFVQSNGQAVTVNYKVSQGGVSVSQGGASNSTSSSAVVNAKNALNGASSGGVGSTPPSTPDTASDVGSGALATVTVRPPQKLNDLQKRVKAENRVVHIMFSALGQSLESFQWEVRDDIAARTAEGTQSGNEMAAGFSERTVDLDGNQKTQYAALVQSAGSPVVSGVSMALLGNGWKYRNDLDMHTHGWIKTGYRANAMDAEYFKSVGVHKGAGERLLSSLGGVRGEFSVLDQQGESKYLATPSGLLKGGMNGRSWRSIEMIRPVAVPDATQ